jgi:hypothetical protein
LYTRGSCRAAYPTALELVEADAAGATRAAAAADDDDDDASEATSDGVAAMDGRGDVAAAAAAAATLAGVSASIARRDARSGAVASAAAASSSSSAFSATVAVHGGEEEEEEDAATRRRRGCRPLDAGARRPDGDAAASARTPRATPRAGAMEHDAADAIVVRSRRDARRRVERAWRGSAGRRGRGEILSLSAVPRDATGRRTELGGLAFTSRAWQKRKKRSIYWYSSWCFTCMFL